MGNDQTKAAGKKGSGEGPADEVAARRAKAAPAGKDDAAAAAAAASGNGANGSHKSLEELAAEAGQGGGDATGEADDGQVFILEQGKNVTLGSLFKRGTPVTFEVQLTGKTLKGPGNMLSFDDPDVTLVVPARAGKVEVDPTYDDEGKIKKVSIRQKAKATTFYDARTEAARVALGGE